MGQTLEHGIFLPDEGERNCYSGLAENWVALDTLVGAYSSHYQNTTIHVTASDKQTWNGKQDALSQTQLDAVNSGIDSTKVQQIATNTSDISSLQSGKANDSDVVHKSGDETIAGEKNFQNTSTDYSGIKLEGSRVCHITADHANDGVFSNNDCSFSLLLPDVNKTIHVGRWTSSNNRIFLDKSYPYISFNGSILRNNTFVPTGETNTATLRLMAQLNYADDTNKNVDIRLVQYDSTASSLYSNTDNVTSLGVATRRWSKIYGTEYYYGSNNVEFSTKFVTTDTNQTISGAKTFSDTLTIYNNDSSQATKNLTISSSKIQVGDTSNSDSFGIVFNAGLSYVSRIMAFKDMSGTQNLQLAVRTKDSSNNFIGAMIRLRSYANGFNSFESDGDNLVSLGSSSNKWKSVQTYQVNGVEPSSLSLPSGNVSNVIDISSYITALDGTSNGYTVPANGWISIAVIGTAIDIVSSSWSDSRLRASSGNVRMLYPVLKNETVDISVLGTTLAYARFIPCQGNV